MPANIIRTVFISLPEALVLWALWMAFVSNPHPSEMIVGIIVAVIAAVADGIVKSRKLVSFFPHISWIALIFLEPWYALEGSWQIFLALLKHLLGKQSEAELKPVRFDPGGDDDASEARRALAITYFSIPPNFIVLGIDIGQRRALVHQVSPTGVPLIAKKLGASE
jgi:hypothetical protein